ncbi:hypothetical protein [Pedobacter hartonius]|uniref:Uncharacterized protein n=1 Tax=Pedobacter hartonius TaxID=425514 RepID=A0A1H4HFR4_9SPHI|nr:hypothetical protein [Pedobacter hartonius]SEB20709.1 hypothetical protein SAMN05443550_11732 [Pedobacter hartonius]
MKFCVLTKISKRSVSFWYQSDNNAYAPLSIKESNEIPLYFYVNGNDFIFGSAARDRFNRHDPHAYGRYFEIIKDPSKHFSIYGNKKPVKQLFYYGIEQYLSYFLNTVLYKTDSIESYRQNFPLRFLFDTDIEDNEKSLIEHLFKEAGYFNLDRVFYNRTLFQVLSERGIIPKDKAVLLLSGIDDVLYLKLYKNISADPIGTQRLEGQGADPRVKILADMIVEYIILQNSYLSIDKDLEIAVLLPFCASLLENIVPIIKGDAELSDGNKYWFRVNERSLSDRLQYYSNDNLIYSAIDELLKTGSLLEENVFILLGTEEISTSYFSTKLLKKYRYVKEVQASDIADTMKSIFAEIAYSNYSAKPKEPTAPPVLPIAAARPPLPAPKVPPPLPPKKGSHVAPAQVIIPKLPEMKAPNPVKVNPVKLPPLPPKKGS